MSISAYVKLVPHSKQQTITLEEVKELIQYYQDITSKTGKQLSWQYGSAAFPYLLEQKELGNEQWCVLKGKDPDNYKYLILSVGKNNSTEESQGNTYVEIELPDGATHGDKGKANEYSKFLAKKLQAELHLFNGRIMYFYKR